MTNTKSGKRENSRAKIKDRNGEKRKPKTFFLTPTEVDKIKTYLESIRSNPG